MLKQGAGGVAGLLLRDAVEEWSLVEFDFQRVLHIDLDRERHTLSWRHFRVLLGGLLSVEDSLVGRRFRPEPDKPGTEETYD